MSPWLSAPFLLFHFHCRKKRASFSKLHISLLLFPTTGLVSSAISIFGDWPLGIFPSRKVQHSIHDITKIVSKAVFRKVPAAPPK